jgi:SAM-dependent methyltransferase
MTHTNGEPESVRITADDWLRGYFTVLPESYIQGGGRVATRKQKNIDFLRLRDVALHLVAPAPGRRVLDIGCANGPTMIYCGLQGARVDGVDLDPAYVADANAQLRRFRIDGEAIVGDATKLPYPNDHFDAVISSDFVEHIADEQKVAMFAEARRVLKPGGVLVTKTPNLAYLKLSLAFKRARAIARLENPFRVVIPHTPGTDDPQHIGLTSRWPLSRCLRAAGYLNFSFVYAPLRRFGESALVETLSTEVPVVRDWLCEDLFCIAYKPIVLSHFPD